MILLVAATFAQARLAAKELGLEEPNRPGSKVVAAYPPDGAMRICGLLPERVVFVGPWWELLSYEDSRRYLQLCTIARSRAVRAGAAMENHDT